MSLNLCNTSVCEMSGIQSNNAQKWERKNKERKREHLLEERRQCEAKNRGIKEGLKQKREGEGEITVSTLLGFNLHCYCNKLDSGERGRQEMGERYRRKKDTEDCLLPWKINCVGSSASWQDMKCKITSAV